MITTTKRIYWQLKIEESREPNIRKMPYPYHYDDYENYFSMVSPEEFEKFRLGVILK